MNQYRQYLLDTKKQWLKEHYQALLDAGRVSVVIQKWVEGDEAQSILGGVMSDLREGVDSVIRDLYVSNPDTPPEVYVEAVMNYLRQHDGHAEFVRAVKAFCIDRSLHRHEKLTEIESLCDRALCDAELEKENRQGARSMRGYITNLAVILRKAQGVIDAETNQPIDIGGEVLAIRQEGDALSARIAEGEKERDALIADVELLQAKVAALEALLRGAPHSVSCQTMWPVPAGQARWPCNCFKSKT